MFCALGCFLGLFLLFCCLLLVVAFLGWYFVLAVFFVSCWFLIVGCCFVYIVVYMLFVVVISSRVGALGFEFVGAGVWGGRIYFTARKGLQELKEFPKE